MDNAGALNKILLIKKIYFYLVSFVALMMVVFSLADLVNTALKMYVFKRADNFSYYPVMSCNVPAAMIKDPNVKTTLEVTPISKEDCEKQEADNKKRAEEDRLAQREQDLVRDISMIVVGLPLFALHWMGAKKKDQE